MVLQETKNLRKLVAELFVVRATGHLLDSQRKYPAWELSNNDLKTLLHEGIGGVILHDGSVFELKERCKTLRSWSNKPILLCADIEEGVGQRFEGGSWLPPPMALGLRYLKDANESLCLAEEYGRCVGHQARKCGLNWVLGPVCDVNSNPLNPVINMRSWGSTPQVASELVCAFHKGLVSQGVLSCAKHFPGHGETTLDSHLDLPILSSDLERLAEIELIPFKAVIAQGINSVMTAHVLFSKIDPQYIATFSKKFLIDLLRKELGFQGIVVTDALLMKAISKKYGSGEAAVMAFEAGADLILMPQDPFEAIDAIVESILNGRISLERLEQSLQRRQREMSKLQVYSSDLEEADGFSEKIEFETARDLQLVNKIIDISSEMKNESKIRISQNSINLIRVDNVLTCRYLSSSSPALMIPKALGFKNILCHDLGVSPWQNIQHDPLVIERFGDGPFLLQLFVRGNPFRGDKDLDEPWIKTIEQLQRYGLLSGVVVYGSCYFWENLLQVLNPSIPAAYNPGQMFVAQNKILQSFFKNNFEKFANQNTSIEFTN